MRPSNIPESVRQEILRRKLADLQVELASLQGHMAALPKWEKQCKSLGRAMQRIRKWEGEL